MSAKLITIQRKELEELKKSNEATLEYRREIKARAKTSSARQTKIIKNWRLKKEIAESAKKHVSKKTLGYKRALESAGILNESLYEAIKIIHTTTSKVHQNWLIELGKGLKKRKEYQEIIEMSDIKIKEAQLKAQVELKAITSICDNDMYTAEEEIGNFDHHGLSGFDCENPDDEL